jgi:hypothetical protein
VGGGGVGGRSASGGAAGGAPGQGGRGGSGAGGGGGKTNGGGSGSGGLTGSGGVGTGGVTGSGGAKCGGFLFTNPDFEQGLTGWTAVSPNNAPVVFQRGDAALMGVPPASGDHLVMLGGTVGDYDLAQSFAVPTGVQYVTLMGLLRIVAPAGSACQQGCANQLSLQLETGAGLGVIRTWGSTDASNTFVGFAEQIPTASFGSSAVLHFHYRNPGATQNFLVYLDQISLQPMSCPPGSTP